MFREITAVYSVKNTTLRKHQADIECGTYTYHLVLKGYVIPEKYLFLLISCNIRIAVFRTAEEILTT